MASTGEAALLERVTVQQTPTHTARWSRAATPVAGMLFVAYTVALHWGTLTSDATETGDFAADSLQSQTAWTQTDGVHSRWGYHHPGPLLFWVKRAAESLFGWAGLDPFGTHMLATLLIAALSIGLFAVSISTERNRVWLGPLAFVVALVSLPDGSVLVPWGPTLANWVFLFAVAAVTAAFRGWAWGLPVGVAAAIGLVHLHLLLAPFAVLTLAGLAVAVRARRPSRTVVLATATAAGLMLLPLLVGVLTGGSWWSSYLATRDSTGVWQPGWANVVTVWLYVLAPATVDGGSFGPPLLYSLALLVLSGILVRAVRGYLRIPALAGAASLLYVTAASTMDYLSGEHFGRFLPTLLIVTTAAWFAGRVRPRLLLGGLAALVSFTAAVSLPGDASLARYEGELRGPGLAEEVVAGFEAYRATHSQAVLVVDYEPPRVRVSWNAYAGAASVAVLAERRGLPWCELDQRWPYWVEDQYLCRAVGSHSYKVIFDRVHRYTINSQ